MSSNHSSDFALIVLHGPLNSKTIEDRLVQRRQYQVLETFLKAAVLPVLGSPEDLPGRRGRSSAASSAKSPTSSSSDSSYSSSDDEVDAGRSKKAVFLPEATPAVFHIYSKSEFSAAIHKCQHEIDVKSVFLLVLADVVTEADAKRGNINLSPTENLSFSRLFKENFLSDATFRSKISLILDTTVMTPSLFDNREKQERIVELKQYLNSMNFREVLMPLVSKGGSALVEDSDDLPTNTTSFTRGTESFVIGLLGSAQNPLAFANDLLKHSHAVQQAFYRKQESTQVPHVFDWSPETVPASWAANTSAPQWWLPNFAKDLLRSNQFPLAALSFGTCLDVASKLVSSTTSTAKKRAPSAEPAAIPPPSSTKGLGLRAAAAPFTPGAGAPPPFGIAPGTTTSSPVPTTTTTTTPMFTQPPPGYSTTTTTTHNLPLPSAGIPADQPPQPAGVGSAIGGPATTMPPPIHPHTAAGYPSTAGIPPPPPSTGNSRISPTGSNHSGDQQQVRRHPEAIQRPSAQQQDLGGSNAYPVAPVPNLNSKAPIPNGTPPAMMRDAYDIPPTKEGALAVADDGIPHKKHSNRRWCVVCETEVCGADNWIAHSTGEKHRRRKENLIASNNPIQANLLSGFATNRVVVPVGPYASAQIRDDRQWCQLCECFIEKGQTWHQHLGTQKHYARVLATSTPISRAQAQHLCRVCDVQISGERNVQLHVDGNRHRRKVAAARAKCGGCGQEFPIREDLDEHRSHCDHNPLPDKNVMNDLLSLTAPTSAPPAAGQSSANSAEKGSFTVEGSSQQPPQGVFLNMGGGNDGATTTTGDIISAQENATLPSVNQGSVDYAGALKASKKNTGVIGEGHFNLGKNDMSELEHRYLNCFALDSCC